MRRHQLTASGVTVNRSTKDVARLGEWPWPPPSVIPGGADADHIDMDNPLIALLIVVLIVLVVVAIVRRV